MEDATLPPDPCRPAARTAGDGSPVVQCVNGSVTLVYGYTLEQLRFLIDNRNDAKLDDLTRRIGVAEAVVRSLLGILHENDVKIEDVPLKLPEIAGHYKQAIAEADALRFPDGSADGVVQQAKALYGEGRFEQGDKLLSGLKDRAIAAVAEDERREQTARDSKQQWQKQIAFASATQAEFALSRLQYRQAADRFGEAARTVAGFAPDLGGEYLLREGDALERQGNERADSTALQDAIDAYRQAGRIWTSDAAPLQWARVQRLTGNALQLLGRRELGRTHMREAAQAYEAALEVLTPVHRTSPRTAFEWARTEMSLGFTLTRLGSREIGDDRLRQAEEAFKLALQALPFERVRPEWCRAQMGLGEAHRFLAARSLDLTALRSAVDELKLAAQWQDRQRAPMLWASTDGSLGAAEAELGERSGDAALLSTAVETLQSALSVLTRERVPLGWARTQHDLGRALLALAGLDPAQHEFDAAISAYQSALLERRQDRVPLDWAETTADLAHALMADGLRRSQPERLAQGAAAYEASLAVLTQDREPFQRAMVQIGFARDLSAWGAATREKDRLRTALTQLGQARAALAAGASAAQLAILDDEIARIRTTLAAPTSPAPTVQ